MTDLASATVFYEALTSTFYVPASGAYSLQLIIISVLCLLSFLAIVVTLVNKIRGGDAFLFKFTKNFVGDRKYYIKPHPTILWCISSGLFIIFVEIFIVKSFQWSRVGTNLRGSMLWRSLIWAALYAGGWFQAWSTAIFTLTVLSTGRQSRSASFISIPPLLLNTFFIAVPLIAMGVIVPLSLTTSRQFNALFGHYLRIGSILDDARPIGQLTDSMIAQIDSAMEFIVTRNADMVVSLRHVWMSWAGVTIILIIIFFVVATSQSIILHKAIKRQRSSSSHDIAALKALQATVRSVVVTSSLHAILCFSSLTVNFVCIAHTDELVSGTTFSQNVVIGILWTFIIFGGIANALLLYRSTLSPPRSSTPALPLTSSFLAPSGIVSLRSAPTGFYGAHHDYEPRKPSLSQYSSSTVSYPSRAYTPTRPYGLQLMDSEHGVSSGCESAGGGEGAGIHQRRGSRDAAATPFEFDSHPEVMENLEALARRGSIGSYYSTSKSQSEGEGSESESGGEEYYSMIDVDSQPHPVEREGSTPIYAERRTRDTEVRQSRVGIAM